MEQYNVTGMSCAACQMRVEKAVRNVEGVTDCAVNLLTNSMGVEGSASSEKIIAVVEKAGYGASLKISREKKSQRENNDASENKEIFSMKKRFFASVFFLIPLMYVSMGHMMWNWPLPVFLKDNHVAMGLYELLISALVMIINQKFFINGFKGLVHKSPNMDTLISLGSAASFGYSVAALFAMSSAVLNNQSEKIMYYMDQFYFESAAMILTLITFGKMLEAKSKGKTTDALKSLMKLAPETAVLLLDGIEKTVPVEDVKSGDKFVLRPGDKIPADGIVVEGQSAVNESAITGESIPVEKKCGDKVTSATINTSGYMVCQATGVGDESTLSKIIKLVSDASATKAPVAKIADKVAGVFVPVVILISLFTLIFWLLSGENPGYAIGRAVSVLVISCPCALGLATPVAIMVGNGVAAKNGILFKTAVSLEQTGKTKIAVLDKTGTITSGIMKVADVIPAEGVDKNQFIKIACSLESKSEHPLSKAIVKYGEELKISLLKTSDFNAFPGNGVTALVEDKKTAGGNLEFIKSFTGGISEETSKIISEISSKGKTPLLFASENKFLGIISVSDSIKTDSAEAVAELKKMGIHVVMLTGDNEITAAAIGEQAGVDEIISSVKPDEKESVIRKLKHKGAVIMVGDGINDAPSIASADVGIAIGAGTDVAIDAADVVLMRSSLTDVVSAIRISKKTLKNIHENLFWAFFYNVTGIPLAAGCFVSAFGWTLNPMFGAAAMGLSSFCVVSNALRLNFIKVKNNNKTEKIILQENKDMKITVKGMMCSHCEAHVKKALEAVDGIVSAAADHEKNLVTITTSKSVDENLIKAAVTDAGYEYAGIKD